MKAGGTDPSVLVERRAGGRVAVVTINRPHRRNACDLATRLALRDQFAAIGRDDSIRLMVLTGAGGHFCAGDDIKEFAEVMAEPQGAARYRAAIQASYQALQEVRVPAIAAISGACVGGGLSLAMYCDFRIGDASARLGIPAARLSVTFPTAQLQRLAGLVGLPRARRWLYDGSLVDAAEALQAGILDELVEPGDPKAGTGGDGGTAAGGSPVVEAAIRFGAAMMEHAPLALACLKLQFKALADGTVAEDEGRISAAIERVAGSEDAREAARAFREKRRPVFKGR